MNSYSVSIDSDAQAKIKQAANWYDHQSPDLGDKFRDQVNLQFNSLKENPGRHTIFYRDVRRVPMQTYPDTIHYIIEDHRANIRIYDFIDDRRGRNYHPRKA